MLTVTPIITTRKDALVHLVRNLTIEIEGQDSLLSHIARRIGEDRVSVFALTHGRLAEEAIGSYVSSKRWSQPAEGDDEGHVDLDLEAVLQFWFLFDPTATAIIHPTMVKTRRPCGSFQCSLYYLSGTNVYCIVDSAFTSSGLEEAITACDQSASDMLCVSFLRASRSEVEQMSVESLCDRVQLVATHAFDREGFVVIRFDKHG